MAIQATLDEMESLFESPEDTKAETKTVMDNSVMGIETLLDIMSIASQDGRESNQEDLSNSITPLLDKGKARVSILQDLKFKNFIKTLVKTARVCNTPLI